jgi:hypothetical protein
MAKAALAEKDDAERMGIGGNKPPLLATDDLAKQNTDKIKDLAALLEEARALPEVVTSDEEDGKVTDVVRALQTNHKRAENARVETKAPYLAAQRLVDSFFGSALLDKIEKTKSILEARLTVYKRKKDADERARLLEVARVAKVAADALAAEAERVRLEAARERQEEEAAAAFEETVAPLAPQQMGTVKAAENAALDAAFDARSAEKAAYVKPAELTRNRSASGGAASTLVETWTFEITNIDEIPLDVLRSFIPRADIEKAIRRHVAVHKGNKPLAGVRIYSEENARVY